MVNGLGEQVTHMNSTDGHHQNPTRGTGLDKEMPWSFRRTNTSGLTKFTHFLKQLIFSTYSTSNKLCTQQLKVKDS